jgi:D-amino-acid oxidase
VSPARTIAVLGAGVVGLSTALVLLERGHRVTVYADATWQETCSSAAGAIWFPVLTGDTAKTPRGYEKRLEQWTSASWERTKQLARGDWGVRSIVNHELFTKQEEPPGYLTDLLPNFEALEDFGLPLGYRYRWTFETFLIETPVFMPRLVRAVGEHGGTFKAARFSKRGEARSLGAEIVVNCTGLGSRYLFGDLTTRGVRGFQLLHEPASLQYAIVSAEFSCLPRADSLALGSLFVSESAPPTISELENLQQWAYGEIWSTVTKWRSREGGIGLPPELLQPDRVRSIVTGVRPYREGGIRLEVDAAGNPPIVHNYGHGGSGFTVAWGCAFDVATLCEELTAF